MKMEYFSGIFMLMLFYRLESGHVRSKFIKKPLTSLTIANPNPADRNKSNFELIRNRDNYNIVLFSYAENIDSHD